MTPPESSPVPEATCRAPLLFSVSWPEVAVWSPLVTASSNTSLAGVNTVTSV